jgi:hypothetical protein
MRAYNTSGLAGGKVYDTHEIEQLASDVVQLHLGVHTILNTQPLAFMECLVRELRRRPLPDDLEEVLADILPEVDDKALSMVTALTTGAGGGLAPV